MDKSFHLLHIPSMSWAKGAGASASAPGCGVVVVVAAVPPPAAAPAVVFINSSNWRDMAAMVEGSSKLGGPAPPPLPLPPPPPLLPPRESWKGAETWAIGAEMLGSVGTDDVSCCAWLFIAAEMDASPVI